MVADRACCSNFHCDGFQAVDPSNYLAAGKDDWNTKINATVPGRSPANSYLAGYSVVAFVSLLGVNSSEAPVG